MFTKKDNPFTNFTRISCGNLVEQTHKKSPSVSYTHLDVYKRQEINRLQRQNPNSPDYNVQRNYLDFFTDLPWETYSKDIFDINKAERVLDKAHFGLEDIKKRICLLYTSRCV